MEKYKPEKMVRQEEIHKKEEELEKRIRNILHSRNFERWGLDMNLVVSLGAGLFILLFCAVSLIDLEKTQLVLQQIQDVVLSKGNWVFVLATNLILLTCLFLACSKYGNVRIGGVDARPRFSNFSWYSMLISAGMGIGLMFYGVGEPLIHSNIIPPIYGDTDTVTQALAATYFHWGIHPWAIYALVALALAFYAFNKKLPLSMRSVFYPIFKEKVFGVLGDIIDLLTVIACLFGLAASLGIGSQQINSGLNYVAGVPYNSTVQILLIIVITGMATLSVVTGLDKGVKILSRLNIKLAMGFMIFIFLLGPTSYIIELFINSVGLYFNDFVRTSFYIAPPESTWQGEWSIFYLAWWISWSPFVGMFIARISRGRTVREFLTAVIVVPSFITFAWMSVFGGTAAAVNEATAGGLFAVVESNLPVAMFEMLKNINYPFLGEVFKIILYILALCLIVSFFVTSSDSGSLVVDNITSGGKLDSPVPQRIFWACMEGAVAAVLLMIGGAEILNVLQTAIISTGFPFAIILSVMAVTLLVEVKKVYIRQHQIKNYRLHKLMNKRQQEDHLENMNDINKKITIMEQKQKTKQPIKKTSTNKG